MMLIP